MDVPFFVSCYVLFFLPCFFSVVLCDLGRLVIRYSIAVC